MNSGQFWVFALLLANLILALVIWVLALFSEKGRRATLAAYGLYFFFCPVVGATSFAAARLLRFILRSRELDESELSFNKERERAQLPPDVETEMNYVPVRDALALEDTSAMRRLLLDLLKNDALLTTGSVSLAVRSADAESAHYAASAITDFLSEFRSTAQGMLFRLKQAPYDVSLNLNVLAYLHEALSLHVMGDVEQRSYVYVEEGVADNLYTHNMWYMTSEHYLWIVDDLLEMDDFISAEKWLRCAQACRPDELNTAKCEIHLYYREKNRAALFGALDALKKSDITVDKEMLDMFRVLNDGGENHA